VYIKNDHFSVRFLFTNLVCVDRTGWIGLDKFFLLFASGLGSKGREKGF